MDMPDLHIICGWAAQPEVKGNVSPWLLCLQPLIQKWFLLAPKTRAAKPMAHVMEDSGQSGLLSYQVTR